MKECNEYHGKLLLRPQTCPPRTYRNSTLVSYRTLPLCSHCPALTPLLQLITPSRHWVPLTMYDPWMACFFCHLFSPICLSSALASSSESSSKIPIASISGKSPRFPLPFSLSFPLLLMLLLLGLLLPLLLLLLTQTQIQIQVHVYIDFWGEIVVSRVHATLHPASYFRRSVGRSVLRSITLFLFFINSIS